MELIHTPPTQEAIILAPTLAPIGPMSKQEFEMRLAALQAKYGPNVALKMARRERRARSPQHKSAMARRRGLADVAIATTGEFHSL